MLMAAQALEPIKVSAKTSSPTTMIAAATRRSRTAGKYLNFSRRILVARLPHKKPEKQLATQEQNPRLNHGFVKLMVNGYAGGGDIDGQPPGVHHEESDRYNRDHCDDNREQFAHV